MKLTNIQLNVLTATIFNKVEDKINAVKKSEEYTVIEKQAKKECNYDKVLPLIKRFEDIKKIQDKLKEEQDNLRHDYKKIINHQSYLYHFPTITTLNNTVEDKINSIIGDKFPSKLQIESEIILASIDGNRDIVSSILTKLNLD